jgi:hypothetical protein
MLQTTTSSSINITAPHGSRQSHSKRSHLDRFRAGIIASAALAITCNVAFAAPRLTAAEIVAKNVAARGGLAAWRNVQSISMAGQMDAGKVHPFKGNTVTEVRRGMPHIRNTRVEVRHGRDKPALAVDDGKIVQLPYSIELKRPRKVRLELQFDGKTAVQVYDGNNGWKLRPYLGRTDVEPYTEEEARLASQQQDLDGFLIDHAAKGTKVELEGQELVEGQSTYKLKLTLKSGDVRHVWIDATTFLEARIDGTRRIDGKQKTMMTYFRNYKRTNGLILPHLLETRVDGVRDSERIIVERVALNPSIDDSRFSKPQ